MLLAEGDRVAADAELLSAGELQVDESLLTGESVPVSKNAGVVSALHAGTLVVQGQGLARVTATGPRSQMGQIGHALQTVQAEESPLRRQTRSVVHRLAWLGLGLCLLLVLIQGLSSGDWLQALLAGIALAIAMMPEEFTVVLTVLPALGAWRLSHQQVLTRRIAAIETLGATSVLCVDKTGTLTVNRMRAAWTWRWTTPAAPDCPSRCMNWWSTPSWPAASTPTIRWSRPSMPWAGSSWRRPSTCTPAGHWCMNTP